MIYEETESCAGAAAHAHAAAATPVPSALLRRCRCLITLPPRDAAVIPLSKKIACARVAVTDIARAPSAYRREVSSGIARDSRPLINAHPESCRRELSSLPSQATAAEYRSAKARHEAT